MCVDWEWDVYVTEGKVVAGLRQSGMLLRNVS